MATKYSDLIEIRESATAFKIDPENGNWQDFIPNDQFNDVLSKVISSVYNNNTDFHKPFWLAGTYGSGKSHAGAVVKHLLCDDVEDIREYVETEYKNDAYETLRADILNLRAKKRLLPVSLYGGESISAIEDLPFIIQKYVNNALKIADVEFEVSTDFDNYIQDIERDNEFWELVIERDHQLKAIAPNATVLISKLKEYDPSVVRLIKNALRKQNRIVPLNGGNLADWIFEVQDRLAQETQYDGLLIVWDEFTDVLKDTSIGLSVLVALQGISERMMMSENNSYFLFISHPSALDSLQVEEREKTKGRYHYMPYNMETVSAYKIMSRKFKHIGNELNYQVRQGEFVEAHSDLYKMYAKISTSTSQDETKTDLQNLFPLHPGTANLATYYAREAGSSSRSVFEFLGTNPKIREFLNCEEVFASKDVITADYLWDYVVVEFNQKVIKFGAVTERYNSRNLEVKNENPKYFAVFKGILLLNALNNIANNETVTPSEANIRNLYKGTSIEPDIDNALSYLDEKGIIQRAPGGLYSIQFSSLPTKEIEDKKAEIKNTNYKYTSQIVNFGGEAEKLLKSNFTQITRPTQYKMYSTENHEHTLLSKIENGRKTCKPYEVFLALLFARNAHELNELKQIAYNVTSNAEDKRFENVVFVVYETPLGDENYERFIEYQANASVAQGHGFADQYTAHIASANTMIKEWIASAQRGTFTYYLRGQSDVNSAMKIALTINSCVSPIIFSQGPESLDILRSKSGTYWRQQLVKDTVRTVLTLNTKQEICDKCTGQYAHMSFLLQDSVNENLEWKPEIDSNHPLKLVCDFIDKKLTHTNKNTPFNLGEKLQELTLPPFGLFPSCASMGMVAFAMRKYIKQIFDLNGKPLDAMHLAEAVVEIFKTWDTDKSSPKVNYMFETKEAGELCKLFVQSFKLNELKGYNDITSLTDARWALIREYLKMKNFPLWSLKYADNNEGIQNLIDNIIKVCDESGTRNPHIMVETLQGLKQLKFELKQLLSKENAFRDGFVVFIQSIENVAVSDDEIDEAIAGVRQHVQETVGLWSEDEVRNALKDWRLEQRMKELPISPDPLPITPPSPQYAEEFKKKKEVAVERIHLIRNIDSAKRLLEQIVNSTNDNNIISLINECDV